MQENEKIIGQELTVGILRNCLVRLGKGQGSVVCISGEAGLGKSFLLSSFSDEVAANNSIDSVFVQCQPPIGNVRISSLQPLLPFQRILEKLEEKKTRTAGKRFAFDVGMTTLASVPIGGDLFYWVKEVGKAFEQYKKERKHETNRKISIGAEFYYNALYKALEKKKLALFIDDMHWCDSQSLELLTYFLENIESLPLMFVFSFNKSIVETNESPLNLFLEKNKDSANIFITELESFTLPDIREANKLYLSEYSNNPTFDEWLFQKSYGVPGTVIEYLKYFQKNTPFLPNGELSEHFSSSSFLPANIQTAFSDAVEKLDDEEKNVLSICSAEGREFTALVTSQLMNTDVLSTIKKLRSLINKTRIIKSIGAKVRYGQTTTVYEFSQAFYQSYFENGLEYEEKVALHGQIAAFLKNKYEEAENEAIKHQLAPYVAAHSTAAGDDETAKEMLLVTAQAAQNYGSTDIMEQAYESYVNLTNKLGNSEESKISKEAIAFNELFRTSSVPGLLFGKSEGSEGSETLDSRGFIDFISLRRIVVDDFLKGNFNDCADKTLTYYNSRESELRLIEQAQLLAIAVRAYLELSDMSSAETYLKKALSLTSLNTDPVAECFVNNAAALFYYRLNKINEAFTFLRKAAQRAINLPPEIRLLTISNIALIEGKINPEKTKKYYSAIKKLTRYLNFDELNADIFRN